MYMSLADLTIYRLLQTFIVFSSEDLITVYTCCSCFCYTVYRCFISFILKFVYHLSSSKK